MPIPRAGNDVLQIVMLRLPSQLAADLFRGCDEPRRITSAPRRLDNGDRVTGYFARSLDHFAHRIAASASNVVNKFIFFIQSA